MYTVKILKAKFYLEVCEYQLVHNFEKQRKLWATWGDFILDSFTRVTSTLDIIILVIIKGNFPMDSVILAVHFFFFFTLSVASESSENAFYSV